MAAAFAGLAGGLYAFAKGSVFPSYLAIGKSVDALIMVLLGGIRSLERADDRGLRLRRLEAG